MSHANNGPNGLEQHVSFKLKIIFQIIFIFIKRSCNLEASFYQKF